MPPSSSGRRTGSGASTRHSGRSWRQSEEFPDFLNTGSFSFPTARLSSLIRAEIEGINSRLANAVAHDIASTGASVAEHLDCVLAVGEKEGIRSEMLRADVPKGDQPVAIDPTKPATWKRPHSFDTTKESYEFLAKLEKVGAKALGPRVMVGSSPWAEFNTEATMALDRAALDKILHPLREIVGTGEVQLSCDGLFFASGQDLQNWVADHKTALKEHEISQVVTRNEPND